MPAFSLVRPTFPVAKSWYDSLQTSVRMLPSHGLNFLASYTLGKTTDHVSGLNIGGEARPVLPVMQGDEASIERALEFEKGPALFDARHRFVVSFGYELPTLETVVGDRALCRRRLAVERHLPGADRFPADGHSRRGARHPLHDVASRRHAAIRTTDRRRRRSGSTRRASRC